MIAISFFAVLFGAMGIGVPIALVLVLCGIVLMFSLGYNDPISISMNLLQGINSFTLMAIPFFVLSGELMNKGGLSLRIVKFAQLVIGTIRGGLGYTAILTSVIFSGLSGSGVADAAAVGGIMMPIMEKNGYKKARAAGLISSAGIIAPIIPPSTPFILIGAACGLSVSRLFMGGIIPGLIIGIGLMIIWGIVVRVDKYYDTQKISKAEAVKILKDSVPAVMLPLIIIVGIRFGLFTPTEAGSFAVVYAFIICRFYYKELSWKKLMEALFNSVVTTSAVVIIVGAASVTGYYITLAQIPTILSSVLSGLIESPTVFLLVVNLFLLVMGMLLDVTPNILIFAPILLPLGELAGFNTYHMAFIITLNLVIGAITPPVGTVLFVSAKVAGVPALQVFKYQIPFLALEIGVLLLFIFFPDLYLIPLGWLT